MISVNFITLLSSLFLGYISIFFIWLVTVLTVPFDAISYLHLACAAKALSNPNLVRTFRV
jgi:hypothetical protein